jgi:hypothetical protein
MGQGDRNRAYADPGWARFLGLWQQVEESQWVFKTEHRTWAETELPIGAFIEPPQILRAEFQSARLFAIASIAAIPAMCISKISMVGWDESFTITVSVVLSTKSAWP